MATIGVNCCDDDDFDEVTLYRLSDNDLFIVTVEDNWDTECSVDIDQMSINEIQLKIL